MIPASTIASSRAPIAVLARLQLTPENTSTPYIFPATKAYALLCGFVLLTSASLMMSWYCLASVSWPNLAALSSLVGWYGPAKAFLYLQDKVLAVRITSRGFEFKPWWSTLFLWFQINHKTVNIDWRVTKLWSSLVKQELI